MVKIRTTYGSVVDRVMVSNHSGGLSRELELHLGVQLVVSSINPKKRNQGRFCRYKRVDNNMAYVQFLDDDSRGSFR